MTATLDELKQALVETLDHRGVLGQVKAKVRAEIFAALDNEHAQRPELPRENVIINELIREYFEYNGYHHALSVLLPESGHPEARQFDRKFLAEELRFQEDDRSKSQPLIYGLVRGLHSQSDLMPEPAIGMIDASRAATGPAIAMSGTEDAGGRRTACSASAGSAWQVAHSVDTELAKGSLVRVTEDFQTESHPRTLLKEGWEGMVVQIEHDTAAIQFDRPQSSVAWVKKQDFIKLKIIKADVGSGGFIADQPAPLVIRP